MDQRDSLYHELILDLYRHPLNKKIPAIFNVRHKELNPVCGDEVELFLNIEDRTIIDVGFQGNGCAISQASASVATEELKGKTIAETQELEPSFILETLHLKNINPTRLRCATLALEAIKKATVSLA